MSEEAGVDGRRRALPLVAAVAVPGVADARLPHDATPAARRASCDAKLEDVRWFARDELGRDRRARPTLHIPPREAIARRADRRMAGGRWKRVGSATSRSRWWDSAATTSAAADLDGTRAVVDAALDEGVTLLRHRRHLRRQGGSEKHLGEVLKGRLGPRRARHQVRHGHAGRTASRRRRRGSRAVHRPGRRGLAAPAAHRTIDLYQYHEPDGATPIAETLGALNELVERARCATSAARTSPPHSSARRPTRPSATVTELRLAAERVLAARARGMEAGECSPSASARSVGVLPFFPLKSGLHRRTRLEGRRRTEPGCPARRSRAPGRGSRGRPEAPHPGPRRAVRAPPEPSSAGPHRRDPVVGGLALVVALRQPDDVPLANVDRRIEVHAGTEAQIRAKLASRRRPAALDFSGWNWTP